MKKKKKKKKHVPKDTVLNFIISQWYNTNRESAKKIKLGTKYV